MDTPRKEWYVLTTLTGQEQKAQRHIVAQARGEGFCDCFDIPADIPLDDAGSRKKENYNDYNVVVPTERVVEIKDGKKRQITRRVCPGYVIVRMALYLDDAHRHINQELWQLIQGIPGVTGFAGCKRPGDKAKTAEPPRPRPISDEEAANLLRRVAVAADRKPRLKVNFQVGETVRVTEGPFMNFNGTIEEIDPDSGRLQIAVSIFGRSAPVTLEYWQVERLVDHPEGA